MKKFILIISVILAVIQTGCNKMDSTYRDFLKGGPITYSQLVDSIKAYPGRNRVLLSWLSIKDPRVTKMQISWANGEEVRELPVSTDADTSVIIDGLTEGNYVFDFYTFDDQGNHSVRTEVLASVYDTLYEKSLILRDITDVTLADNKLAIAFKAMNEVDAYDHQEITYRSALDGQLKTVTLPATDSVIEITDFSGESFNHKSAYKPTEYSPDDFYSGSRVIYTPANPLPDLPAASTSSVSCAPQFTWYNSVLVPNASYQVLYSTDQANWTAVTATENQRLQLKDLLLPNTQYFWKVTATSGSTTRESAIQSFTTGAKTLYADGEAVKVQSASSGANPVRLIITGDGFQQMDYIYDAGFDRYVAEAVEAFFSVEPYKSYRSYFEVWKVAAYSTDQGISESDKSVTLNTAFQSSYSSNTITCDTADVYSYAKQVPGVDDAALSDAAVVVLLNKKRQGGASYVTNNQRSIALVPIYKSATLNTYNSLKDVMIRQAGGFGFGLLADENSAQSGTLTPVQVTELQQQWAAGRSLNVDLTGSASSVRWAHFIGRTGYSRVNVFEGAYGFRNGIYRCEEVSSMINGINYFNVISRELIVKRILRIAGETYNLDDFLAKDVVKSPYGS